MSKREVLPIAVLSFCAFFTAATATAQAPDVFVKALYRLKPVLKFDTKEKFFPVRVKAATDHAGNKLLRDNGDEIAVRRPNGSGLNIWWLRGGHYPDGTEVRDDDKLELVGDDDTVPAHFQSHRSYRDRIYGRVKRLFNGDRIIGAWLQYWFFYYYDRDAGGGDGHDGDWEMIQIKVDEHAAPTWAVYAQHRGGTKCRWGKVGKDRGRPAVYVARGKHASYYETRKEGGDDPTDGKISKRNEKLIRLAQNRPLWLNWHGKWGNDGGSPDSLIPRENWKDPEGFFDSVEIDDACKD
jgi:hypothetical protein